MNNRVEIRYCPKCNWLPRASWIAQEILQTFPAQAGEVALIPADSGTFTVTVNGKLIYDRRTQETPLDPVSLKRHIRDEIAPGMSLGHADKKDI